MKDEEDDVSFFFELDVHSPQNALGKFLARLWLYKGAHDPDATDLHYFELLDECLLLWEGYDEVGEKILKAVTESFNFCGRRVHRHDVTND